MPRYRSASCRCSRQSGGFRRTRKPGSTGAGQEKGGGWGPAAFVVPGEIFLSKKKAQQSGNARPPSQRPPRHIEFMTEELPKSGSGKILKRVLREKYWAGQSRRV